MNIEEKINIITNEPSENYTKEHKCYLDPGDAYELVEFTKEAIELIKHYSDRNVWLSTIGNHLNDWYDHHNHNGYDGARKLMQKWNIK